MITFLPTYILQKLFISSFNFGCTGPLVLHTAFFQLWQMGVTFHHSVWASHCGNSSCCGAQALGAPWHMVSSWTKDWTHVPCIGRQTINHRTTREFPTYLSLTEAFFLNLDYVPCYLKFFYDLWLWLYCLSLIFPSNLDSCKILQWKIYTLPDYMPLRCNVSTHSLLHDFSLNPTFSGSGTSWAHENFSYQSICYTYHYWKWKFYFLPPYVLSSLWSTLCWKTLLCSCV